MQSNWRQQRQDGPPRLWFGGCCAALIARRRIYLPRRVEIQRKNDKADNQIRPRGGRYGRNETGGDGIVGLDNGGGVHQLGRNFLVRTLGQWVAQPFAVVLPDAPNGTPLTGQRHLPAYADAISRVIDF